MSLFFDYKVQAPRRDDEARCMDWSNDDNVLAVGWLGEGVRFYGEEGEEIPNSAVDPKGDEAICCLKWHPKAPILATGWTDGHVVIRNFKEDAYWTENTAHNGGVNFLCWSPDGTRLVSGDDAGVLWVWSVERRGQLSSICPYRKDGALRHCVFAPRPAPLPALGVGAGVGGSGVGGDLGGGADGAGGKGVGGGGGGGGGGSDLDANKENGRGRGNLLAGMGASAAGISSALQDCPMFLFGGDSVSLFSVSSLRRLVGWA